MQSIVEITHSEQQTEAFAAVIAKQLRPGDVIRLFGELGAGKTAFVRGLAIGLGAGDVSSPTFAIMNVYGGEIALHHFDLYRISGLAELADIGFYDVLGLGVTAIEWPQRVGDAIEPPYIDVDIQVISDQSRCITITGTGRTLSDPGMEGLV